MKKIVSIFLSLCMIATMLPIAVFATDTATSGTCGASLTWTLSDDGELAIDGTGAMTNWTSAASVPWYDYRDSIVSVSIGAGVTSVGNYAFYRCLNLSEVSFPDNLATIGKNAFYYCKAITEIAIPQNVESIGNYAFGYCSSLVKAEIYSPNAVFGKSVFINAPEELEIYSYANSTAEDVASEGGYLFVAFPEVDITDTIEISAPSDATVTVPADGWLEGGNTFNVAYDADFCVIVLYDDGTYKRVEGALAEDGSYDFTAYLTVGAKIAVRMCGDVNGDGSVTEDDPALAKSIFLDSTYETDPINRAMADENGDGVIKVNEVVGVKRTLIEINNEIENSRTSDLFIITATPLQSYADGYEAVSNSSTCVGIQPVVNGAPMGSITYVPVEMLGIEASEVENYLHYSVELIDYDAETGVFYEAKLGAAPDVVYADDVELDSSANNIVIDGTTYTLADAASEGALDNELLAYPGTGVDAYRALYLVELEDGSVVTADGTVVAMSKGYIGNTKYYAAFVSVPECGIQAGTIVSEAQALEAWGYEAFDIEYARYITLTAYDLEAVGAFELQLFDDDVDGKYDRAIANPVYMSAYSTYEKDIDGDADKEVCDRLASTHTGCDVGVADVIYTEELELGTVFTYTFNEVTNTVSVIDIIELQTGKLTKIDTTAGDGTYKFTLGDTVYTAKSYYSVDDFGAIAVTFNTYEDLTLANLNKGAIFDIQTDWNNFLVTAAIGYEYNFYEINGNIIFAELVEAEVEILETKFVVLDSVADFDFGSMDLNVYADGEEKTVALIKFKGTTLADLPSWYFGLFLGNTQNFLKGLIYAVNETPDGINVLGFVDENTCFDYRDTNGNPLLQYIDLFNPLVNDGVITFEDGIVRYGADGAELAYHNRIRTTDTTVFYFIDYGTGIENEADTSIEVYVGAPEDATIILDEYTYILVDKIGYTANVSNQGSTQLVIVVNANDYDFDVKAESQYVYFTGAPAEYEADEAVDFDLEGYAKDARFYKYTDGAINLETGEYVTMYTPVDTLTAGKIYELDENGVIIDYDALNDTTVANYGMTTADAATAGLILDWSGDAVVIDNLVEEKYYDIKVNGATQFDYDDYKITKVRVINIGADHTAIRGADDTVDPRPAGDSDDILYEAGSIQTAWNLVHNLFHYSAANGDTLTSCFVWNESAANTDGEIVILYAYN